jgi:Zn-dependent protease with chaperone function
VIYSNLLIFLTAIFLFSIKSAPAAPAASLLELLLVMAGCFGIYAYLSHRSFQGAGTRTSAGYFKTEKRFSVLALVFYAGLLSFTDVKYYCSFFSFGDRLPVLTNIAGLALFIAFLSLMWLTARNSYFFVFGKRYRLSTFLALNIRTNLPIVLPWVVLSLFYDLLALAPFDGLKTFMSSTLGDLLFFVIFLVFVMIFFPPLVRRLWGCKKLPEGSLKDYLSDFCRRQNFKVELYIWPLFEGRVLTAGVMGLVPGLRYILLTPAIIETMSISELEAVMAHEIGHVKKKHLLMYVLLISGFSVIAGLLAEPLFYYSFSFEWVFQLLTSEKMNPDTVIGLIVGVPFLILLLLYFRFIFGYFIRNFERQADLYVIKILGSGRALISAFDRIAGTSGESKKKPNWHHFGIGERIDTLERCEKEPSIIDRQDKKVRRSLIIYVLILVSVAGLVKQMPTDEMAKNYQEKYIELDLLSRVQNIEDKALWFQLVGDLMINRQMEQRALVAYNKALEIDPANPVVLNNLAWLLLTSEDSTLRNPLRALILAQRAVLRTSKSHVLDTLATAYWANGLVEEAIRTEMEALSGATSQREFYREQIEKFRTENYQSEAPI